MMLKHPQPGASILPDTIMHSPLFQIPPIFEKCSESVENFPNFTFSQFFFPFSSAKISDGHFFSHRPTISNFPSVFPVSVHFPPVSRKLLFLPYFQKSPLF